MRIDCNNSIVGNDDRVVLQAAGNGSTGPGLSVGCPAVSLHIIENEQIRQVIRMDYFV